MPQRKNVKQPAFYFIFNVLSYVYSEEKSREGGGKVLLAHGLLCSHRQYQGIDELVNAPQ